MGLLLDSRVGGQVWRVGFVVESLEDLEYASETLPGATSIYELKDAPGGGKCVTFYDPVDGWPMHLVRGQEERNADHDKDPL